MCDKSISCGGSWKVCGSSSEVPFCDSGSLKCCPSDKPYYWNGQCQACTQDYPNRCGGSCWKCDNPSDSFTCYNGQFKCCPSNFPVYCARTDNNGKDACWKSSTECDNAQQCGNEGWTVCRDPPLPYWNCRSDGVSRCCPTGYPYLWKSDWLCHTTQEPQKCSVPDGTSSNCNCNSDAECKAADSSRPYCGNGGSLYDVRTPQGYHACLSLKPKYCGDGSCEGSETYSNCQTDCGGLAPKGTITTGVVYYGGSLKDKPIQGAYVSLDDVRKGTTDANGKINFEAAYGYRTVKVTCPDSTFCDSKTINVDGAEYNNVRCSCNPPGDSDGDGSSDNDERLLGTDPMDPNENFYSAFLSFNYPQSCLDIPGLISLVWKNKDNLAQANEQVIQALNTTLVMAADLQEHPYVVASALSDAKLGGELVKSNVTVIQALESSEYVGGFFTDNGAILVMTDSDTKTTAVIAISATCVGNAIGGIYGAGTGVKDDVVGIWTLIKGLWHMATSSPQKIASDVVSFIRAIPQLFGKSGELFHDMIIGILQKGNRISEKTVLFTSDKKAYLNFQIGFTNGFVSGYVLEQIAATFVGAGVVLKALKVGTIVGKVGKILKLPELLTRLTESFGGEIAKTVQTLKYAEKIAEWTDEEQNALARLLKLINEKDVKTAEKWIEDVGDVGSKSAVTKFNRLTKAGKLSENEMLELMKTKLGRQTLEAAEASDDLILKQSKLVSKWGANQFDEVASRFDGFWPWQKDGWKKVNKFLDEVPTTSLDGKVKPDALMNVIGDKDFEKIVDSLKDLKKADGTHIDGVDRSVRKVLENPQEARNEADNLLKASEMKKSRKTIEELESPLHDPVDNVDFPADIKYKDSSGTTKYVEHKNRKWPKSYNADIVNDLNKQLQSYKNALGSLDNVRLSSRNTIEPWLKQELVNKFGKTATDKLLGVE